MQRPVNLIQLSDCHLFADESRDLIGIRTCHSFANVVSMIKDREPSIDQILVTGDISQDDSLESYQFCRKVTSTLKAPCAWLRGNHDEMAVIKESDNNFASFFPDHIRIGNWVVLMLNTQTDGAVYGTLSSAELDKFESQLVAFQGHPILVAMHHHPVPVGSRWIDEIALRNSEAVLTLLKGYPQVQTIIHGHTHQERDIDHQGVRILGIPSTCVQFKPEAEGFATDDLQPGYRKLRLYPDGQIETEVYRLPAGTWIPDKSQPGY
ncbi:3',5'-cyclic-AMP phosphodiesterase [Parendozoicomonas sp. Alg238-R29]|uniref:3',5'-cyclic-AMP phosphodiesterase n=1 Tax=Parendozoicomonas sp. Alg238-R29 TaxID=2993446 RepID=UPI00248E054A|nr:3',5'-cyclic-AMP phosphodiesterase [Parendozoicomonas sp. Alg238-R29]